jgi:hypothetical protein
MRLIFLTPYLLITKMYSVFSCLRPTPHVFLLNQHTEQLSECTNAPGGLATDHILGSSRGENWNEEERDHIPYWHLEVSIIHTSENATPYMETRWTETSDASDHNDDDDVMCLTYCTTFCIALDIKRVHLRIFPSLSFFIY